MSKTIQGNIAEVERIEELIRGHCLCLELAYKEGTEYLVRVAEGYTPVISRNNTKRNSLCDLAMHLEKLWIHGNQVTPIEERIEMVKKYRNENNLHLSKGSFPKARRV